MIRYVVTYLSEPITRAHVLFAVIAYVLIEVFS